MLLPGRPATVNTTMIHPITPDEILDLGDYERQREGIRAKAMAARAARRITVGPAATFSFESRETLRYQIQEILRAERIAKPVDVLHEIETYSELLPSADELSATLMFEFPDPAERNERLAALVGVETHLRLEIDGAGSSAATFDQRQLDAEKVSAVQFIRFPLTDAQRNRVIAGARMTLAIDHPAYVHSSELRMETAIALAADLVEAEEIAR